MSQPKTHNPRWYNFINAPYALRLYNRGMSWKDIGIKFAKDEGREVPYQALSVYRAVLRWRQGKTGDYFD